MHLGQSYDELLLLNYHDYILNLLKMIVVFWALSFPLCQKKLLFHCSKMLSMMPLLSQVENLLGMFLVIQEHTLQIVKKQQHEKDDSDRWLQARPMSTSTVDALRSVAAIAAQAARAAARDSALAAATVKQAAESLRSAVLDPTTIAQIEDREHDKTTENILISSADHQVSAQYIDDDNYVEDNDEDDNLNSLDAENSSEIFEEDDDDEDDEKFEETSSILNTDDNVRSPTKPNIEPIEQYDEVNNKYVENDNLNKPPAYENTVASTKSAAGEEEEEIDFDETSSNQNRTYDR
mmetsp:Transcript_1312/g.1671  ORF Transcript_1312/g.1671 Transcript_1312/m.1671 type:complete len:293 (+) Transcript_1312:1243-2121(+)